MKRLAIVMLVGAGLAAFWAGGQSALAAGPVGPASCMGQEAAGVSPPGSSDEAPGGMPDLVAFIDALPGPPGATYKFIASLHEDSHEACDEALEG